MVCRIFCSCGLLGSCRWARHSNRKRVIDAPFSRTGGSGTKKSALWGLVRCLGSHIVFAALVQPFAMWLGMGSSESPALDVVPQMSLFGDCPEWP